MFKFIRLIFFIALVCLINIFCKKEKELNNTEAEKGIIYKELNASIGINKNSSLKMDINVDGSNDFEVYRDTYSSDSDTLSGFFVRNLGGNKMSEIKLSDNSLFASQNLMSYNGDEVISESLDTEYAWNNKNGLLTMKHLPNGNLIGRWSDGKPKMIGIMLSLNGKSFYGWVRFQYQAESHSITVLDYAYNPAADGWIRAGQKN